MTKEQSELVSTRAAEWSLFWFHRIAEYWTLGTVDPGRFWRQ